MGNRDSSSQIPDDDALNRSFTRHSTISLNSLTLPGSITLCITDGKAKNRPEKKIKLPSLQIRPLFATFATTTSSPRAKSMLTNNSRGGQSSSVNTAGIIRARMDIFKGDAAVRRSFSVSSPLSQPSPFIADFLSAKMSKRGRSRLSGRKRAECISISFSRLLLAKMVVVVVVGSCLCSNWPDAATANAGALSYNRE